MKDDPMTYSDRAPGCGCVTIIVIIVSLIFVFALSSFAQRSPITKDFDQINHTAITDLVAKEIITLLREYEVYRKDTIIYQSVTEQRFDTIRRPDSTYKVVSYWYEYGIPIGKKHPLDFYEYLKQRYK